MKMKGNSIVLSLIMCAASGHVAAQMDNVVEVENNYRPTVRDANKINITPQFEESTVTHYNVDYSVNAAATEQYVFQPMWADKNARLIKSDRTMFASFGYGTEGNVLGRFAGDLNLNKGKRLEFDYITRGYNGTIQDIGGASDEWNSRYYNTRVSASFIRLLKNRSELKIGGGFGADLFNYQPMNSLSGSQEVDCAVTDKQHDNLYNISMELTPYSFGKFAVGLNAGYEHFEQKYMTALMSKNSEDLITVELTPEFEINDRVMIDVELGMDYAKYGMTGVDGHTSFDFIPHLRYQNEDLSLCAGAYINSEGKIAPDVDLAYHANHSLDFYVKATGGETAQNFRTFSQMTPYFSMEQPTVSMEQPTVNGYSIDNSFDQLRARAGVRLHSGKRLMADISAGYDIRENVAELQNSLAPNPNGYSLVTFVDSRHFHADADIIYEWEDKLSLNLFNQYNHWSWDDGLTYIWRPVINLDWNASYHVANGLRIGADMLYQTFGEEEGIDRPATLNLSANISYTFPCRLTLYARGNNLLGKKYQQYMNYYAQDKNFLFGAAFTF